jgi:hypothetical protein
LKPENVLLKDESDEACVESINFGLSRKHELHHGIMSPRAGAHGARVEQEAREAP